MLVTGAGGGVMTLELVGSRILAPYFGGTTVVWTALIGIILASLALGYWWGGWLADRRTNYRALLPILLGAAALVGLLAVSKEAVLEVVARNVSDVRVGATVATVVLFALPSFLMASVGPFVIRLEIRGVEGAGSTIGRLNAASTGGSIVGTFLAGFVLLAWVGHFNILLGICGLFLALASLTWILAPEARQPASGIALLLFLAGGVGLLAVPPPRVAQTIVDTDSHYARILVAEYVDPDYGRPVRAIFTDIYSTQGAIFLDDWEDKAFGFERPFAVVHHFRPDVRSLLVIGGGVCRFPMQFLEDVPDGQVDVVEIDPRFIELATEHFGLRTDPRMTIANEDGRTFVARETKTYDAIIIDAFSAPGSVPYQLTTREFVTQLRERLNPGGVVIVNLISAISGERGLLLQAEFATYASVFPTVEILQTPTKPDVSIPQNIVLVASVDDQPLSFASSDPQMRETLSGRFRGTVADAAPLTDDYAPVDYFFMRALF